MALALAVLGWAVLAPAAGAAPTADEIIARNVEARGGADKLHALALASTTVTRDTLTMRRSVDKCLR